MEASPLFDVTKETNNSSHALFKSAFPDGFAWELLERASGKDFKLSLTLNKVLKWLFKNRSAESGVHLAPLDALDWAFPREPADRRAHGALWNEPRRGRWPTQNHGSSSLLWSESIHRPSHELGRQRSCFNQTWNGRMSYGSFCVLGYGKLENN